MGLHRPIFASISVSVSSPFPSRIRTPLTGLSAYLGNPSDLIGTTLTSFRLHSPFFQARSHSGVPRVRVWADLSGECTGNTSASRPVSPLLLIQNTSLLTLRHQTHGGFLPPQQAILGHNSWVSSNRTQLRHSPQNCPPPTSDANRQVVGPRSPTTPVRLVYKLEDPRTPFSDSINF